MSRYNEDDITVFMSLRYKAECKCKTCGDRDWVTFLHGTKECLECAGLDHLEYLSSGNSLLTRRARRYSGTSAVVLDFSKSRDRYERQGSLVELEALERAENEVLYEETARERQELRKKRIKEAKMKLSYIKKRTILITGKYSNAIHSRLLQFISLLPDDYQHIGDMWLQGYSYAQIIGIKKINYNQLRRKLDWRSYRTLKSGERMNYRGGIIRCLQRLTAADPVILKEINDDREPC